MTIQSDNNQYFDARYGIASVAISTIGVTVVATTQANYHGISMLASATNMIVKVYDASVGTTGNMIDVILVVATGTGWSDKYIPIVARKGITISVTGTGGVGVVFYGPRG